MFIGMNKDSKDFAGELFDALSRRRNIHGDSIHKAQLREFWDQIADQSFDSRLQTFFDMWETSGSSFWNQNDPYRVDLFFVLSLMNDGFVYSMQGG